MPEVSKTAPLVTLDSYILSLQIHSIYCSAEEMAGSVITYTI